MSYIDILIERAFSDGYEYAQKEFASARQEMNFLKTIGASREAIEANKLMRSERAKKLWDSRKGVIDSMDPSKQIGLDNKLTALARSKDKKNILRREFPNTERRQKFINEKGELNSIWSDNIKSSIKSGEHKRNVFNYSIDSRRLKKLQERGLL